MILSKRIVMHVQNVIIIEKRYCDFILCLIDLIFFEYMF